MGLRSAGLIATMMDSFTSSGSSVLSAVLTVAALLSARTVSAQDGWVEGRASFYGNDGGATIHQGSCMYG